jgi:hypothetical protein
VTGIVSRWVVLEEHVVTADDLDGDGDVLDEVVERWIGKACAAYLDRCRTLHEMEERGGLALRFRVGAVPPGARLGRPTSVAVSAGAREVRRGSFTIAVRLRGTDGASDIPVNASCVVSLEHPTTGEPRELGDAVRDELIALEQAAQHFN